MDHMRSHYLLFQVHCVVIFVMILYMHSDRFDAIIIYVELFLIILHSLCGTDLIFVFLLHDFDSQLFLIILRGTVLVMLLDIIFYSFFISFDDMICFLCLYKFSFVCHVFPYNMLQNLCVGNV
jgi:hypothetical protein